MPCSERTLQKPYGYIYLITNTVNGKVYVGQTKRTLRERWADHRKAYAHQGERYNCPLYRAFRKYGLGAFTLSELEQCSDLDLLNRAEQKWVSHYHSTNSFLGYNATSGGGQGRTPTLETRAKLSASKKKQMESPEARRRVSEGVKKQWEDPIFRQRMTEQLRLRGADPANRKHISETLSRYVAEHPEAYEAVVAYNKSPEGRRRNSESHKALFRRNPEVILPLQEGAQRHRASPAGQVQVLQSMRRARERRKELRGDWVSEEVLCNFVQGLSARAYEVERRAHKGPGPMPCVTSLCEVHGKSFREIRDGSKGRWAR